MDAPGNCCPASRKAPLRLRTFCSNSLFARRSRPSGLFPRPGVGSIPVGDVTVVKSSVCVALRLDDIFRPVSMLQGLVDAFGRSATCEKVDDGRWTCGRADLTLPRDWHGKLEHAGQILFPWDDRDTKLQTRIEFLDLVVRQDGCDVGGTLVQ